MRFIDIFAGLAYFNIALEALGHTCVFASEIDWNLRSLYQENFGLRAAGDITEISSTDILDHDILCAGFPCQPFSKARQRNRRGNTDFGDLYQEFLRIARVSRPQYIIMENVPDLLNHNAGNTWNDITGSLRDAGYEVAEPHILSPHYFRVPQTGRRLYIIASLSSLGNF